MSRTLGIALALAMALATMPGVSASEEADAYAGFEHTWLALSLQRGQMRGGTVLALRGTDGRVLLPLADLERLRLVVPAQSAFEVDGTLFVPLDRLPGVSYRVDLAALTLSMDIPPGLFASKSFDPLRASVFHEPDPGRGAYLDYDVQIQDSSGTTSLNGFAGLSTFHDWAVGVATFTGVDSGGGDSYLARLDTAVFADRPDRMQTWRIGDSYTRAGAWGRPVRFAGAQWQTKFSTQPGFVTTPTLRLDGETALPSTLEVYADNMLRFSSEIPPGPFEVPDLPLLVGGGEIRMVVRDVLGRETIVQQPYYSASGLLRPGLDNFSIEAGVIRRGYGSDDDRYAGSIAAATWRRGVTEHLTLEGRAEANDDGGAAGAAVTASLGTIGSIDAFAAASATETEGHTLGLSLRRQRRGFTIGCESRTTSRGFFAAGFDDRSRFERDRLSALATMTLGRSSLSASYVTQTFYKDAEDLSFASLQATMVLGRSTSLTALAVQTIEPTTEWRAAATLSRHFGGRHSASLTASGGDGTSDAVATFRRSLPTGTGIGYRVLAGVGETDRVEAEVALQNDVGTLTFGAARSGEREVARANVRGGLVAMGGGIFPTRFIGDSFAIVDTSPHTGVRVYAENQLVGTTNAQGLALVPRLRPYESNQIEIDHRDVPLASQTESFGRITRPRSGAGTIARFEVSEGRAAIITLVRADGSPVPTGARVRIGESDAEIPVGFDGQVFLEFPQTSLVLTARWNGSACRASVVWTKSADGGYADLGAVVCQEIEP